MNPIDPSYPGNPRVPMNCPRCGVPLRYMGTFLQEPKHVSSKPVRLVDVHVYDCPEHGIFHLTDEGLEPPFGDRTD
jgi:hypothetical protein